MGLCAEARNAVLDEGLTPVSRSLRARPQDHYGDLGFSRVKAPKTRPARPAAARKVPRWTDARA